MSSYFFNIHISDTQISHIIHSSSHIYINAAVSCKRYPPSLPYIIIVQTCGKRWDLPKFVDVLSVNLGFSQSLILIWVICQNFALVHCHLESWTIQTIEFRSVMAMRFMTLGLLPRVPESTLVGACVDYSVCRQWSNQKHLDHRFGGIAHSNCLGGSYPPQHVMLVQHGFAACDVNLFLFLCDLAPCAGMVSQA